MNNNGIILIGAGMMFGMVMFSDGETSDKFNQAAKDICENAALKMNAHFIETGDTKRAACIQNDTEFTLEITNPL